MIQAIETIYNGYRFRSRLEARWAVFFDALGVRYEYEKEGFELGDTGRYLPDFWLPQVSMWAEVKPDPLTECERQKCKGLALGTGYGCLFLDGYPDFREYEGIEAAWITQLTGQEDAALNRWAITTHYFHEHRFFFQVDLVGDDFARWADCVEPNYRKAVAAARQARFEYGESGISRSRSMSASTALFALPKVAAPFKVADKVRHHFFGEGIVCRVVSQSDGAWQVWVAYPSGIKVILSTYLTKV